jgi:hypothetical protein
MTTALWRIATPMGAGAIHPIRIAAVRVAKTKLSGVGNSELSYLLLNMPAFGATAEPGVSEIERSPMATSSSAGRNMFEVIGDPSLPIPWGVLERRRLSLGIFSGESAKSVSSASTEINP